uniref:Transmembrane protein n=1 Tax=Macrostomum lignano TaxID=282301 RepID=A0A1I8JSC7_9PLAT
AINPVVVAISVAFLLLLIASLVCSVVCRLADLASHNSALLNPEIPVGRGLRQDNGAAVAAKLMHFSSIILPLLAAKKDLPFAIDAADSSLSPWQTARPISAQLPMELHQLRSPGTCGPDTLDRVWESRMRWGCRGSTEAIAHARHRKDLHDIVSQTLETRPADQSDKTSKTRLQCKRPMGELQQQQQQQANKRPLSSRQD